MIDERGAGMVYGVELGARARARLTEIKSIRTLRGGFSVLQLAKTAEFILSYQRDASIRTGVLHQVKD